MVNGSQKIVEDKIKEKIKAVPKKKETNPIYKSVEIFKVQSVFGEEVYKLDEITVKIPGGKVTIMKAGIPGNEILGVTYKKGKEEIELPAEEIIRILETPKEEREDEFGEEVVKDYNKLMKEALPGLFGEMKKITDGIKDKEIKKELMDTLVYTACEMIGMNESIEKRSDALKGEDLGPYNEEIKTKADIIKEWTGITVKTDKELEKTDLTPANLTSLRADGMNVVKIKKLKGKVVTELTF
ncbi:hypothetical protein JXB01_02270 [Candidatus Micrarchaeota archaeon]|nr:hypothetical protein [Candidatus Micrarchaeota archaeon]